MPAKRLAALALAAAAALHGTARAQSNLPTENLWLPDGEVVALFAHADRLYLGGHFAWLGPAEGGVERRGGAAIDLNTGTAADWNPDADGPIRAFAVAGNRLYVAGDFSSLQGEPRAQLGAFDLDAGTLTDWNPGAVGGAVAGLAVHGDRLCIAGEFTHVGGLARGGLASIAIETGNVTAWRPNLPVYNRVTSLAIHNDRLYIGCDSRSNGSHQPNRPVLVYDFTTGTWPDYTGLEFAQEYGWEFCGFDGEYGEGEYWKAGRAAEKSCELYILWSTVNTILPYENGVVVGGYFHLHEPIRPFYSKWSLARHIRGRELLPIENSASRITTLSSLHGVLYAGPSGWDDGVEAHFADTREQLPWNVETNGTVNVILAHEGVLYVGGAFSGIAGVPHANLAGFGPPPGPPSTTRFDADRTLTRSEANLRLELDRGVTGLETFDAFEIVATGTAAVGQANLLGGPRGFDIALRDMTGTGAIQVHVRGDADIQDINGTPMSDLPAPVGILVDNTRPQPVLTVEGDCPRLPGEDVTFAIDFGEPVAGNLPSWAVVASSGTVHFHGGAPAGGTRAFELRGVAPGTLTVWLRGTAVSDLVGNSSLPSNEVVCEVARPEIVAPAILELIRETWPEGGGRIPLALATEGMDELEAALAAFMDANGDGHLQVSELLDALGGIGVVHRADLNADGAIGLSELLRVIQLYNSNGYHCAENAGATEDGFAPLPDPAKRGCARHAIDYDATAWSINLSELLRAIQFYNSGGYIACEGGEDGFCLSPAG